MGDGDTYHYQNPYQMDRSGHLFRPPRDRQTYKLLSDRERSQLAQLLKQLTTSRQSIEAAMVFIVKNHEKSHEIVNVVFEEIWRQPSRLLPFLYLLSDVLHNSLVLSYPPLIRSQLPKTIAAAIRHLYPVTLIQKQRCRQKAEKPHLGLENQSHLRG